MTPQELKNSILQLAIQGRLVEQRPEEGTAEELYRQIQREKAALVKAGKIKKEKPLPEIAEEEVPFEIPEGWKWVRLGTAFSTIMGQSPDGDSVSENGDGIEFHQGKIHFSKMIINHSPQTTSAPTKIAPANSLLLCVRAPVGKVNITDREICIGRGLSSVVCHAGVSVDFVFYWLQTLESVFVKKSTGTTFKAISADIINNQVIPLPPLAEQKRIVAKIEELLPYIDRYEKAWSRLEDFNKRFPTDMQKSILQFAIQGKLVEQRPEEGTGEQLYQQIQAEKQSLIRSGKLKKEKPLPEISDTEIPFDIPESWKWVRLGEVTDMLPGFAFKSSDFKTEGVYRLFRGINLGVDNIRWDDTVYIDDIPERLYAYKLQQGDVVLGMDRPWINGGIRAAIFGGMDNVYLVQRVLRIRKTSGITSHYIALILRSPLVKNALIGQTTGISVPHISPGQVGNVTIPLPPLAEQKRIIDKLKRIQPLYKRMQ